MVHLPIMQPTIGRIVHLHNPNDGSVSAAIIVNVHEDSKVSLQVFQDKHSGTVHMTRVAWSQTEGVEDYLSTWDWPPRE